MRPSVLERLAAPESLGPLVLEGADYRNGAVQKGRLVDSTTGRSWDVEGAIPRFVRNEGYTASFGHQWNRFRRTQLDSYTGKPISRDRLIRASKWDLADLKGASVLEVGCGAGRFTEVLLAAGADVTAVDFSNAVDACWANHGASGRLAVVQADLFRLPLRPASFDYVLCYGVLQHTPDPAAAFQAIATYVAPGGRLSVDVYAPFERPSRWTSKYLWRWLTKRLAPGVLERILARFIPRWLPIDDAMQRVPLLRRAVAAVVPCWNYGGILPLTDEQRLEWALLDTFDALSAKHDHPQTPERLRQWFERAGLVDVDVGPGGTGFVGNGRAPT